MAGTLTQNSWVCVRTADIWYCKLSWTDDTTGISAATIYVNDTYNGMNVVGKWLSVGITDPGATAPTADYDIYVRNPTFGNIDVFQGGLENRSATVTEATMYTTAPIPITIDGLTFTLSGNSVNGALGDLWLITAAN